MSGMSPWGSNVVKKTVHVPYTDVVIGNPNGTINGTSVVTILNHNTSSVPSSITDTGIMKFNFYINGLYLEPQSIISVVNSGSNVILSIDNHNANFSEPLDSGDEVIGNGKFVPTI